MTTEHEHHTNEEQEKPHSHEWGHMLICAGIMLGAILLFGVGRGAPVAEKETPRAPSAVYPVPSRAAEGSYAQISNNEGEVTVDVIPTEVSAQRTVFQVTLDTHSVELDADMVAASEMRDDAGTIYRPNAWQGDPSGGHHRKGTLTFPAIPGQLTSFEVVIRGVGDIPERIFSWSR